MKYTDANACCNCEFWIEDDDSCGTCRRFPPDSAGWPVVEAEEWCGEFSPVEIE